MKPMFRAAFLGALIAGGVGACHHIKHKVLELPELAGRDIFHDLLLTQDMCLAPSPDRISRAQALADFDVLVRILRRGYAGFDVLAKRGLHWQPLLADMRSEIEVWPEPVDVETFSQWLAMQLAPTGDNNLAFAAVPSGTKRVRHACGTHLDAFASDLVLKKSAPGFTVAISRDPAVPLGARLLACSGHNLPEILRPTAIGEALDPAWLLVALSLEDPPPLECRFATAAGETGPIALPLHRLRRAPKNNEGLPPFERTNGKVPVLHVRDLSLDLAQKVGPFVKMAVELRSAPSFVLDVRDNPGGDDVFVSDFFDGLTKGWLDFYRVQWVRSDVTNQGWVNHYTCALAEGIPNPRVQTRFEQWFDEHLEFLEENAKTNEKPYQFFPDEQVVNFGVADDIYRGGLVVLVNSGCVSGCESFPLYAQQLPGAIVVGENTRGAIEFLERAEYRLPNSRIWVTAGSGWCRHPNERKTVREGIGFLPDLWLDTDEPEKLAEQIASCLAESKCGARLRDQIDAAHMMK